MKPQCIVMCVCMLSVCPSLEAWTFKYLQDLHVPFGYIKHLGTIWIPLTIRYFFSFFSVTFGCLLDTRQCEVKDIKLYQVRIKIIAPGWY